MVVNRDREVRLTCDPGYAIIGSRIGVRWPACAEGTSVSSWKEVEMSWALAEIVVLLMLVVVVLIMVMVVVVVVKQKR